MVYSFLKRTLDVIGAGSGLIIFSPILLTAAVIIKLTSEGPLLVEASSRVGENGKVFRMYKFRSMIKDAHNLIRTDPKFAALYEQYKKNSFKLESDPRITPVGRVLRSTSIDEFPQFINVLKGDMSLVGPRAFYPDELEENKELYPRTKPWIDQALRAKPGITGLWQVSGRSKIGFEKRIEIDASYAKSRSLALDLKILLKTPLVVFKRDGVY
jgi:lipopolysaccharide/colanic/teichoic acid biosynthesis glycosyltransferase